MPTSSLLQKLPTSLSQVGINILLIFAFLCFRLLFDFNMGGGGWNEIDVLPLARQSVDPNWVPTDWYLNQPAGYRLLFQTIFGTIAATWGFLATSLIGRLFCYGLVAIGLGLLGQKLGLSRPALFAAVVLFVMAGCGDKLQGCEQGAIAREWLVGGLETKAIAYGALLPAIGLLLSGQYLWAALLLGIATSFHVLVGGWAFLVTLAWLGLHRDRITSLRQWLLLPLVYGVGSAFAIVPVIRQLSSPTPTGELSPSFIYVFLRLSHHLNPLSWKSEFWIRPIIYLLVVLICTALIRAWYRSSSQSSSPSPSRMQEHRAAIDLVQFTFIALVPFGLGVAIAPFDLQGQLLQFYPFRLGDILLPLTTFFVLSYTLQHLPSKLGQRIGAFICLMILGVALLLQGLHFPKQLAQLGKFPGPHLESDVDWQPWMRMSTWIRENTPRDAIIISPPEQIISFTWFTERGTIAKYKLFPQTKAAIVEWSERMKALSGNPGLWDGLGRGQDNGEEIRDRLTNGYNSLNTEQVIALMNQYQAPYFLTQKAHQLNLPIAYQNAGYILYTKPGV